MKYECVILTVIGALNEIRGHLRPNLLAIKPYMTLPKKTPIDQIETIHDVSSAVSGPVGNGVLSLRSNSSFGLVHPPMEMQEGKNALLIRPNNFEICRKRFIVRR